MFSKDKDKNAKNIVASEKEDEQIHIPDLDDGESAFMEWLNSEDKISSKNHMILKKFQNDKECILMMEYLSVYHVRMIVVHT